MMAQAPKWRRLLITGAAGEIGSVIRPALQDTAGAMRLLDKRPITDAAGGQVLTGDINDAALIDDSMLGVVFLVPLAGIPCGTGGRPGN